MTFTPTTIEEAAEILRKATNGIHISSKHESSFAGDVLSMSNFDSVISYEPAEMIIETQSALSLQSLNAILSERSQWIPTLATGEHPDQTLASAIANDRYHPRSRTLGMLRTSILGGTFITGDGVVYKSGSRVVKSVAGYDIHRSYCGSRGLFGAIVSVTLKVQPRPEMFAHFFVNNAADIGQYHPTICERYDGKYFIELAGYREDIESDLDDICSRSITVSRCADDEANDIIHKLQLKEKPASNDADAKSLFDRLRKAFDPRGVLR